MKAIDRKAIPAILPTTEALSGLVAGEVATLALAHPICGIAIVDERRGCRPSAAHFPTLLIPYTVELLLSHAVEGLLGPPRVSDAVYAALTVARMNVPAEMIAVVIGLIGADRAQLCPSLPPRNRVPVAINAGASEAMRKGWIGEVDMSISMRRRD